MNPSKKKAKEVFGMKPDVAEVPATSQGIHREGGIAPNLVVGENQVKSSDGYHGDIYDPERAAARAGVVEHGYKFAPIYVYDREPALTNPPQVVPPASSIEQPAKDHSPAREGRTLPHLVSRDHHHPTTFSSTSAAPVTAAVPATTSTTAAPSTISSPATTTPIVEPYKQHHSHQNVGHVAAAAASAPGAAFAPVSAPLGTPISGPLEPDRNLSRGSGTTDLNRDGRDDLTGKPILK